MLGLPDLASGSVDSGVEQAASVIAAGSKRHAASFFMRIIIVQVGGATKSKCRCRGVEYVAMYAIIRFQHCDDELLAALDDVADFWRAKPGNLSVDVVINVDQPDLAALVSKWKDIGSYRRAFGGYDAKLLLTPVMLRAVDEPSAYVTPDDL